MSMYYFDNQINSKEKNDELKIVPDGYLSL